MFLIDLPKGSIEQRVFGVSHERSLDFFLACQRVLCSYCQSFDFLYELLGFLRGAEKGSALSSGLFLFDLFSSSLTAIMTTRMTIIT